MTMQFEPGVPSPNEQIPLCVPEIGGNEWAYVKECLDTGWVSSVGSRVRQFEQEIAARVGGAHSVATVNGTAALHITLLVAGVRPDDEVLVSTLTFIAPANAVRYVGAWPVFIDAEPTHCQMDPERVRAFLEEECESAGEGLRNRRTGRRVSAIIPVHILGHPVDMEPVMALASRHGLHVIEDATEALGATCHDRPVGHIGDAACFSFNGNKIITTGGGGMIVTDREDWARHAQHLTTQAKDDPVEYIHREIGYNYRLTNVQAAMGIAQLERLDEFIACKRRIAEAYRTGLDDVPGVTAIPEAEWAESVRWLSTVLIDEGEYGMSSRDLMRALGEWGIQTRPLWQPLHLSPSQTDAIDTGCPVAEDLNRRGLSLPSSVGLTQAQQARVVDTIRSLRR
jgi:perosamine synthetase